MQRLGFAVLLPFLLSAIPVHATVIGDIYVCYACQNTGNAAIDAALSSNPGVASDGILFAFINLSSSPISGGVFSVTNASPNDSFAVPTIAANSTFILIPGVTSDSNTHPSGGLFATVGVQDTSDGAGGLSDSSIFKFTGLNNGLSVSSITAGTSTGTPGTFTPADPGLYLTYRSPINGGQTSFIGYGPNGDGGCSNCYYGLVATLNVTPVSGTPEPASYSLIIAGIALTRLRKRLVR